MGATDIFRRSQKGGASAVGGRDDVAGVSGCKEDVGVPASSSGLLDILAGAAIGLVMSVLVLG